MKAGTLEIELLTNVARLQAEMEQVKKAVGGMTDDVARKTRAANDNINGIGRTGRLAGHHVQNLAFQFQDLGVQMAMAAGSAHPLRMGLMALFQQGAQIQGIMSQAGMGVGGLTKELGRMAGRWGPAIAAIGAGTLAVNSFTDSINEAADTDAFIRSLGLTAKEMKELEDTTVTMGDVMLGTWDVVSAGLWEAFGPTLTKVGNFFSEVFGVIGQEVRRRMNVIIGLVVGSFEGIRATWGMLPDVFAEAWVGAVNWAIREINRLVDASTGALNGFITGVNNIFGTGFDLFDAPHVEELENSAAGAGARTADAFGEAFGNAMERDWIGEFGGAVSDAAIDRFENRMLQQANDIRDDRSDPRGRRPGKSEAEREMERRIKEAERFAEALEIEAARIGKTTLEIKRMEVAAAAAEAPTRALQQRILQAGAAWERAFQAQADKDFHDNVIRPLEQELELIGLTGAERERAALAMEEEAFKAHALADGLSDVNAAWQEYYEKRLAIINGEDMLAREIDQAEALRQSLESLIGTVGGMGRAGGVIGALLGVATGNVSSIGGPFGDLLSLSTGTMPELDARGKQTGRDIVRTLGDELRDIFKLDGQFGKTMSSLLEGAGTGLIAGQALFGDQNTIEQLGSALGGAAGQAAGQAIAGPIGGRIGSVIGSVIGNFAGQLISGTPRGSATIGGVGGSLGVTGTAGSSSARIAAATKSANGIIDALTSLADQLGATLDPSRGSVSIGVRDGNFRVDTTGRGITKTSKGAIDFGEDAEAAAYFAMMDLIKDGVLVGLRAGTERLLRNAKDVETGVSKALAFENVFRELKAIKDPLGAAMDALDKEFDRLEDIFAEAGASLEEYAQLEELYQERRKEAFERANEQALDDIRTQREMEIEILRLLGREQDAVTAARELELAGLKESLKPLQSMIYSLRDAREIIDQFGPLADDLRAFRIELTGGAGSTGFAVLTTRFRATAGLAAGGDAAAMGRLRGDANAFLEAARENAASATDIGRAMGEVLGAVDSSIFAADAKVDYAQAQIDAIDRLATIQVEMGDQLTTLQQRVADNSDTTVRLLRRFEGDGFPVKTFDGEPLEVIEP